MDDNNKRLAKNTLVLYGRTFLVMFIGFFTSRVILNALGVEDYGIFNTVAGFIALFSIISGTLTATTQRFLTFELGKGSKGNLQEVFGVAINIHVGLAIFLLVLFETVGLWFLNSKLNLPTDRIYAANWVYQTAIVTTLTNILSSPYNAVIIAYEKMKAFAYITLLESFLRLLIVYLLFIDLCDRLILYSILYMTVTLSIRLVYGIYCKRHFPDTDYVFVINKSLYKRMFGFAGMNFIGALSSLLSNHGVSILLNIFFGVVVNAAKGISTQIQSLVTKFVTDFTTALNPQITKEYAAGNKEESMVLAFRGSKFSYFLTLIMACPIYSKANYILNFWLVTPPEYAVEFSRLTICLTLITLLSNTLVTIILATGKLTTVTWWIGGTGLLTLPLCYVAIKLTGVPYSAFYVQIIIEVILLFIRLIILKRLTNLDFPLTFVKVVLSRVLMVTFICAPISIFMSGYFANNLMQLIIFIITSIIVTTTIIYLLGLNRDERNIVTKIVLKQVKKYAR